MNPIDEVRPESFFDAFIVPLHRVNARRGIRYLELDPAEGSGWGTVVSRTGGSEKFAADDFDGEAMLKRLAEYWSTTGDANLSKLAPFLAALRLVLLEPPSAVEPEPGLTDFVYPLF